MKNESARLADKTRKEVLTRNVSGKFAYTNFLDVPFDLKNGKFKPYRKPNDDYDPLYINRHSNHPRNISCIKQLPTSINKRISFLSADEQTFHETHIYQNA